MTAASLCSPGPRKVLVIFHIIDQTTTSISTIQAMFNATGLRIRSDTSKINAVAIFSTDGCQIWISARLATTGGIVAQGPEKVLVLFRLCHWNKSQDWC